MYGVGGSQAISRETTSFLFSPTFKQPDEELMKSRDVPMNSDLYQQQSSSLPRYRSAPTSFFASLVDVGGNGCGGGGVAGGGCEDFTSPHQSSCAESEAMFARFISSNGSGVVPEPHDLRFPMAIKHETPEQNHYSSSSTSTQMVYHQASLDQHDLAGHSNSMGAHSNTEALFEVSNSAGLENPVQGKASNGNCSNLVRQSSSPAGFLSNLTPENGFGLVRDVGNFSRLNDHMNFSSGPSSCSRFMPRVFENGNESIGAISPKNVRLGSGSRGDRFFLSGVQNDSWNDSRLSGLKRSRDGDDEKKSSGFSALDGQNGDPRNYATGLTHHLSLTKTSPEMASIEKFLQFQQDSVPCKIRAKRGCATHPRSIAERMRRTRISERMRKLQELFPNMDKQTNTADMLDLAVEYIKDLQKQVKTLTDTRAKCTCLTNQKLVSNPAM